MVVENLWLADLQKRKFLEAVTCLREQIHILTKIMRQSGPLQAKNGLWSLLHRGEPRQVSYYEEIRGLVFNKTRANSFELGMEPFCKIAPVRAKSSGVSIQ